MNIIIYIKMNKNNNFKIYKLKIVNFVIEILILIE